MHYEPKGVTYNKNFEKGPWGQPRQPPEWNRQRRDIYRQDVTDYRLEGGFF